MWALWSESSREFRVSSLHLVSLWLPFWLRFSDCVRWRPTIHYVADLYSFSPLGTTNWSCPNCRWHLLFLECCINPTPLGTVEFSELKSLMQIMVVPSLLNRYVACVLTSFFPLNCGIAMDPGLVIESQEMETWMCTWYVWSEIWCLGSHFFLFLRDQETGYILLRWWRNDSKVVTSLWHSDFS